MHVIAIRVAFLACLLLAGCLQSGTSQCGDRVCGPDRECSPSGDRCVLPVQLTACAELAEGSTCSFGEDGDGECAAGVCERRGCGNGYVGIGEVCDDGNVVSGDGCRADCQSDERCGNATVDGDAGEECDCGDGSGPLAAGCTTPNSEQAGASCGPTCKFRRCGDGVVVAPEECEGSDLGGATCADVGFYGGLLACSPFCRFDTAQCTERCGDGIKNGPEVCDATDLGGDTCADVGYYAGTLACTPGCQLDVSACTQRCGDGVKNGPEQCDGSALGTTTCQTLGFYNAGSVTCTPVCAADSSTCTGFCGDGVKNGPEQCDATDLGASTTCTAFGYYAGGTAVACTAQCTYDLSGCSQTCGDDVKNGPERCDGTDLGGADCTAAGFYTGTLACNAQCGFNTAACTQHCGDGVANGPELCDGSDLAGADCTDAGFYAGTLACNSRCGFNTASCSQYCGDAVRNGLEQCDTTDLAGTDCVDLGYYQPAGLACNALCGFDTAACTGRCGDSVVDAAETCDGQPPSGETCLDYGLDMGGLGCSALCGPDLGDCDRFAWHTVFTNPTNAMRQIWVISPTDVYVGGFPSYHYDGVGWSIVPLGTTGAHRFWGSGPSDVFSIYNNTIRHFDGTAWSAMTIPGTGNLNDIWGTGPNDVFAVGAGGRILHYNGTVWTAMTSGTTSSIVAISGLSSTTVYALAGNTLFSYNGSAWTSSSIGAPGTTTDIWATPGALFVTGHNGVVMRRLDGQAWTSMLPYAPSDFQSVWGVDLNNVVVAGYGKLLHFNGAAWTQLSSDTDQYVNSVGGSGAYLFAAGSAQVLRYHAGDIRKVPSTVTTHTGVAVVSSVEAYATAHLIGNDKGKIVRWNGSAWVDEYTVAPELDAIWAGGNEAFAVGTSGTVLHRVGTWSDVTAVTAQNLRAVWGRSPGEVYAVGENQTIIRRVGTAWSVVSTGSGGAFNAVTGAGASGVVVVGDAGAVRMYDGTTWTPSVIPGTPTLVGVWASSASNIYAIGTSAIYHYNGSSWTQVYTSSETLLGGWGSSVTDIFAVGDRGHVLHFDGTAWNPVRSGALQSLAAAGGAQGLVVFVGNASTAVHLSRICSCL